MSTTEAAPEAGPADELPRVARLIKGFVEHPVTRLAIGLILIVTSSFEAYDSFANDLNPWRPRAHHGLLVLGIVNVLAAIPNLVEGFQHYLAFRSKVPRLIPPAWRRRRARP